eukprot:g35017.t1
MVVVHCTGLDNLFQSPGDGLVPGQMHELSGEAVVEVTEDCLFIYSVVKLCLRPSGDDDGPRASRKSDYTIEWTKQVANPTEGQAGQVRLEILKKASDIVKKNPFSLQAIYVLFNCPRNSRSAWSHSANRMLRAIKARIMLLIKSVPGHDYVLPVMIQLPTYYYKW